jgi:AcrR family transcriptional regulator
MSEGESSSRRQKQLTERLNKILAAASGLFAEKGFHRTTTKEIAEAADVAEGTLYNYFDNKNELLLEIINRLGETQGKLSTQDGTVFHDPRQFFFSMLQSRQVTSEQNTAMQQAIMSEILVDKELRQRYYSTLVEPLLTMLEKQLDMRMMLGQIRQQDSRLSARFITSLWIGLFIYQVLDDPLINSDWDTFAQHCTSILFDGIGQD